jgi:hypothetical protein
MQSVHRTRKVKVCPVGVREKKKGGLEVDQGGVINGKWMRGRRREGG